MESRGVLFALVSLLAGCGFDVSLGFHDGGTCGVERIAGLGLDSSFGSCGTVTLDLGGVSNVGFGTQGLALDAQGRAILGGTSGTAADRNFGVVRLLESGALDPSFGERGVGELTSALPGDHGEGVLVQPDGKVVIAGALTTIGSEPMAVLGRLLPSGLPDTSFGTDGLVKTSQFATLGICNGVLLRPDGALLCSGTAWNLFPGPGNQALLARTAAGASEAGFGADSAAVVDTGGDDQGGVAVFTTEGKLLLPGFAGTPSDFTLARFDSRGLPDPTFTDGRSQPGLVKIDFQGGEDECRAAHAAADGTAWCVGLVQAGGGARVGGVVRVLPGGALDTSFGTGGRLVLDEWRTVWAVLPLDDGRFLLGGSAPTARGDLALALQVIDATGTPQGTLTMMDLTGADDAVLSLVKDERGRVWVFGVVNRGTGNDDFVVQRFVAESRRLGAAGDCSASGGPPLLLLAALAARRRRRSRSAARPARTTDHRRGEQARTR